MAPDPNRYSESLMNEVIQWEHHLNPTSEVAPAPAALTLCTRLLPSWPYQFHSNNRILDAEVSHILDPLNWNRLPMKYTDHLTFADKKKWTSNRDQGHGAGDETEKTGSVNCQIPTLKGVSVKSGARKVPRYSTTDIHTPQLHRKTAFIIIGTSLVGSISVVAFLLDADTATAIINIHRLQPFDHVSMRKALSVFHKGKAFCKESFLAVFKVYTF